MTARTPWGWPTCWLIVVGCFAAIGTARAEQPGAFTAPTPAVGHRRQLPFRLVPRLAQSDRDGRAQTMKTAPERSVVPVGGDSYSNSSPIPLPPRRSDSRQKTRPAHNAQQNSRKNVTVVVFSSLAIVLGLFFLVVWVSRRALPKSNQALPTDALEVLGRAPLAARHNMQLIRLGHRLLLVSVSPDTARTLLEIDNPDEVNDLIAICKQNQPGSITASFRQVLQQMGTGTEPEPLGMGRRN